MAKTYYDILGLTTAASQEDIKRAYRKLAMESHPDLNKSNGAKAKFLKLTEAYEILNDKDKRLVYNQKLRDHAAMAAGRAYAQQRRQQARGQANGQSHAGAATGANSAYPQDEAFQAWVRKAKAQANAQARMKYQEFKQSKFAKTEASIFLYLQFVIMAAMFLFGAVILAVPFVLMFAINWKCVFLGVVFVPVAFKIFREARSGIREIRQSL